MYIQSRIRFEGKHVEIILNAWLIRFNCPRMNKIMYIFPFDFILLPLWVYMFLSYLIFLHKLHVGHIFRSLCRCTISKPGEYVDMVKAGIIDPVKVIRTALSDAAR